MISEANSRADELEGSESNSTYGDDSGEDDLPTARRTKRVCSGVAKPKAPRKKYVRGKQGGLEGIMRMPLEIFTEVRPPSGCCLVA